jgi:tetratricopeptide (TPR) repeat protein
MREDYSSGYFVLGMSYLYAGQEEKAIEAHKKLMEVHTWWSWALGFTYAATGHITEAEEILQQLENVPVNGWNAYGLMTINTALGNMDEAFNWLNYEPHHAFCAWAAVMDEYETLREDSRFADFLARLNLPE